VAFSRTAHLTTAAKFAKKIHAGGTARESLAQRSAMVCALLNFVCMAVSRTANLRDDNKSRIFFAGLVK